MSVEKVKECPRANPPMWTRVDVEEVSEDVPAEEEDKLAEAEEKAIKEFSLASAPMGTSAVDEEVDAAVVADEEGEEVITQRGK